MWLDIISSSNGASRDGNGNSSCKHLEMLKPLSTWGTQQAKQQLKLPAQMLLTSEVRWSGCLLGMSFRVMRWNSHRNQEAFEKLPAVTKRTEFKPFRSQPWPYGMQETGGALIGICTAQECLIPVVWQELGLRPDNMARICVSTSKPATLSPACLILVEHQVAVTSSACLYLTSVCKNRPLCDGYWKEKLHHSCCLK